MKDQNWTTNSTIVVVDDELANLEVVDLLLARENYELLKFDDPCVVEAAIALMPPDVILLDVMMPGLDGIELCRRLKSQPSTAHIPIIMVTALSGKENLARCLDSGADDFIGKPFNGTELRARIRSLLRIKQQYDQLQALLNQREDLTNMVIHDLRNPLANILLSCQILRLYDDGHKKQIDQIEYASHRLETMIDSLLITAKLESGKLLLQRTELDLEQLIQVTMADFQAIASQQNIKLDFECPSLPIVLSADTTLLRRVFDNLITNSLKFAPAQSTVTITIAAVQERVTIQIKDQGRGVSPELREQIFAKFTIGEYQPQIQQIGLGLAFCKMAIEAHDGSIAVSQNHPQGCIFTIDLPIDLPIALPHQAASSTCLTHIEHFDGQRLSLQQ
jgi:two-component system, sensor histidine kinase and response regulator